MVEGKKIRIRFLIISLAISTLVISLLVLTPKQKNIDTEVSDILCQELPYYLYYNEVSEKDTRLQTILTQECMKYLSTQRELVKETREYMQGSVEPDLIIQDKELIIEDANNYSIKVEYFEDSVLHSKRTLIADVKTDGKEVCKLEIWDLADNPYTSDRLFNETK